MEKLKLFDRLSIRSQRALNAAGITSQRQLMRLTPAMLAKQVGSGSVYRAILQGIGEYMLAKNYKK